MKIAKYKNEATGRVCQAAVELDLEMPKSIFDFLAEKGVHQRMRGTNVIYKLIRDADNRLVVWCGSGMLNQIKYSPSAVYRRVAKILHMLKTDHLDPHETAMWMTAWALIHKPETQRKLLSLTAEKAETMETVDRLQKHTRRMQKRVNEFHMQINVNINQLLEKARQ